MDKLIIILREDIAQMTPDEAMKQMAYAMSLFHRDINDEEFMEHYEKNRSQAEQGEKTLKELSEQWIKDYDGFGEMLIMTAGLLQMQELDKLCYNSGILANMVVTPNFPQKNHFGKKYTIKTATSMYLFADKEADIDVLKKIQNWCTTFTLGS